MKYLITLFSVACYYTYELLSILLLNHTLNTYSTSLSSKTLFLQNYNNDTFYETFFERFQVYTH